MAFLPSHLKITAPLGSSMIKFGNGTSVPPVAEFIGAPVSGTAPLAVTFTDQSTGTVESWAWDFGDGQTSTSQNPTHVFAAAGTYTVALTVTGPGGAASRTRVNYANASAPLILGNQVTSLNVQAGSAVGLLPYSATVMPLRGAVPSGSHLSSDDDTSMRSSVLSTWDDGSAAVVVVSGSVNVIANETKTIAVNVSTGAAGAAMTVANVSAQVSSIVVDFGAYGSSAINDFSEPEFVWWANERTICARYRIAAPTPGTTALEAVVDVHAWSDRAHVEVVIENGKVSTASPSAPSSASYDAQVSVNGSVIGSVSSSGTPEGVHSFTRAAYVSWWIGGNPGLRITQNHEDLQQHPLLFKVATESTADMSAYATDVYSVWSSGRQRATDMGAAGDHPSIGPLPKWEAQFLQTGDHRCANATEVSTLAVLSFNINIRDESTGLVPTLAAIGTKSQSNGQWPKLQPAGSNGGAQGWKTSHSPACGLMAFICRPSPVFIEIAQKVAVWNGTYSSTDNGSFTWAAGVFGHWYQTRGKAWGLRSLSHAAMLTPSSHAFKSSCLNAIALNGNLIDSFRSDSKASLGVVWDYSPTSLSDHASNSTHFQSAVWQHHYLAVEAARIANARLLTGSALEAFSTVADWLLEQPVRWINERSDGGWRYVPYSTALGPSKTLISSPSTWAEQMDDFMTDSPPSVAGGWYTFFNNVANTYSTFEANTSAGAAYPSYFWNALAAAYERGVEGAEAAWSTLQENLTGLDAWLAGFGKDPRWAGFPRLVYWGAGADEGSVVGNVWTPGRDESGKVNKASWDSLSTTGLRWYEVANSRLDSLDSVVKAAIPGWTDLGTSDWIGLTNNWVGAAWDVRPGKERAFIGPGGGHSGSANNGVYSFSMREMRWAIESLPTPSSAYPSGYTGETQMVSSGAWGSGPTDVWADEVYDPANPSDPNRSSRYPTSRHTYGSQVFVPELGAEGSILMLCRRCWKFDLATKQWSLPRTNLNQPPTSYSYASYENMFVWWDSVQGRAYHCGTALSASPDSRNFWWDGDATFGTGGYYPAYSYAVGTSAIQQSGRKLYHLQYQSQNAGAASTLRTKPYRVYIRDLDTSTTTTLVVTLGDSLSSAVWPTEAQSNYWDLGGITFVPPINKFLVAIKVHGEADSWAWIDATTGVCERATDMTGSILPPQYLEGKVRFIPSLNALVHFPPANHNMRIMRF